MRLAVDGHSGPSVHDDVDMGGVDVLVGFDEMVADYGGEELGRSDRVLLR